MENIDIKENKQLTKRQAKSADPSSAIYMRVRKDVKERWVAEAEKRDISLSRFIVEQVEKSLLGEKS